MFATYPHRAIESLAYTDYVLVLRPTEAWTWHERFREQVRNNPDYDLMVGWQQGIAALGHKVEATRYSLRWVLVEMYEWESGMDY